MNAVDDELCEDEPTDAGTRDVATSAHLSSTSAATQQRAQRLRTTTSRSLAVQRPRRHVDGRTRRRRVDYCNSLAHVVQTSSALC